ISNIVQGDLKVARSSGEKLLAIANRDQNRIVEVEGHYVMGVSSFWLGEFDLSHYHLVKAIDCFDDNYEQIHINHYAQHPRIICRIKYAWLLSYMGPTEQADNNYQMAMKEARQLAHPFSLAYFLMNGAVASYEIQKIDRAIQDLDECVSVTEKYGFTLWGMMARIFRCCIYCEKSGNERQLKELEERLNSYRNAGIHLMTPFFTALLAKSYLVSGFPEKALETIDQAIELKKERNESWYLSEIYRIKGLIVSRLDEDDKSAEMWFRKAIKTAKKKGARMLELRAVKNLAEPGQRILQNF
ncbi:MAG: hypothetical protein ACFCU6_16040, partial [Balneolaceae bacterium]